MTPEESSVLESPSASIQSVVSHAVSRGQLSDESPVAIFFDIPRFRKECRSLLRAFPDDTLHGFAVKACPIISVIRTAYEAGMGAECASEAEMALCRAAGVPPEKIIFDSPAKTDVILRKALDMGVHLNGDDFDEIERIETLLRPGEVPKNTVGLRVNPQIGSGTISMTSTAGLSCKFGVPLLERRSEIIAMFEVYSFLRCIHVHVGSQGCTPQLLVDGVASAVALAEEINSRVPGRVTTIDIGGGLSVDYGGEKKTRVLAFWEYEGMLRDQVPNLFNYKIMTEFGRRLAAPVGFIATFVQAIKSSGGKKYIIGHAGADICMRAAYAPDKWRHNIELRDKKGKLKAGDISGKYDVAGPLCFSGDIIGTDREFSSPQVGDVLVIRDAGAYTFGMYSRHTSQLVPAIYAFGTDANLSCIKKKETLESVVQFWGGDSTLKETIH